LYLPALPAGSLVTASMMSLRQMRLRPTSAVDKAGERHQRVHEVRIASPQTEECMQPIDVPMIRRA